MQITISNILHTSKTISQYQTKKNIIDITRRLSIYLILKGITNSRLIEKEKELNFEKQNKGIRLPIVNIQDFLK